MKARKSKKLALVHIPQEPVNFWERQISAELEVGGGIHLIIRKDSILECVNAILLASWHQPYDDEPMITVTFKYWQLDDDCNSFNMECAATDSNIVNRKDSIHRVIRRLCAQAKMQFVTALAKQGITLTGQEGALAA